MQNVHFLNFDPPQKIAQFICPIIKLSKLREKIKMSSLSRLLRMRH